MERELREVKDDGSRVVVRGISEDPPEEPAARVAAADVVYVNGGNTADGTNIFQWTCNGGANQKWRRG